jgi:hypothetical protein
VTNEATETPAFCDRQALRALPIRRTTMATARVPQPMAVDGVVEVVAASRTLVVRPVKRAGYAWTLWMQAHLALVERPWADLPEARGPGSRFISRGEPGGELEFAVQVL